MALTTQSHEIQRVKEPLVYRVAPDKHLHRWNILREGDNKPCAKGLSKEKAVEVATRLAGKRQRPAFVLVHKTRYIIERWLQFSH